MGIFDFLRKPVAPMVPMGTSGTPTHQGFIFSLEKNPLLTGQARYQTYSDIISNTSIVAAGTRYFLNLIAKSEWKVEPADDSARAEEIAELVEAMLHDMETPLHRVVRRAGMFPFYGFSIQEWTAKMRPDGAVGLADIEARPQKTIERWDVDETGTVNGVVQRSPHDYREIYLPRAKLVYLVDDALTDSPEGLGLFRNIVQPARDLARLEQLEGFGFETDLRGVPIGRAPFAVLQKMVEDGKLSKEQKLALEQPMRDFIMSHIKSPALGLLLDSITYQAQDEAGTPSDVKQWDMDLLKAGSTSQQEVASAIERKNREIARVLGVENLLLGSTSSGSHALSRDKSGNFAMIVDSTLLEIRMTFRKDVLGPLALLNGWDPELLPKLKTASIQYRDIEQITGAMRDMASAGAMLAPDDPVIQEVRDLLGLSKAEVISVQDAAILNGTNPNQNQAPKPNPDQGGDTA